MKKITLLCFLIASGFGFTQNWTTQTVTLDTDFSVKFDVNITTNVVTMTMIGPSNRWLGIALTNTSYSAGSGMGQFNGDDVITYNSSTVVDRVMGSGNFTPPIDTVQNWSVLSDDVVGSTRTLVATRARDTGDSNDFIFPTASPSSFTIVWAKGGTGTNNSNITFHTGGRSATLADNNVLSNEDFQPNPVRFTIFPNPSNRDLNIGIAHNPSREYSIEVYDILGKQIYRGRLLNNNTSINTSNWRGGVYLVKLTSDQATQTKRFVQQ